MTSFKLMDTMFHLFTSDSKYTERSVNCGLIFRIFWSTRLSGNMKCAHVYCGRYGYDCVCFSGWVPMYRKNTLFQTFKSALGGGVGDVHRPGSVASYGRRRQKVIQTHLQTHLKNRPDSFFFFFHGTDVYRVSSYRLAIITTHSNLSPVSCVIYPRSICFILVHLRIRFPSCLFTCDFCNWNLYVAYVSEHFLNVLSIFLLKT